MVLRLNPHPQLEGPELRGNGQKEEKTDFCIGLVSSRIYTSFRGEVSPYRSKTLSLEISIRIKSKLT